MCKMLLSINPEHVKHILDGSKEYEYRKIRCRKDVDRIIIYATSPIKKIVAEAKVETILEDTPDRIWEQTHNKAGVSSDFFFKYYEGRTRAVAYKLIDISVLDIPRTLVDYGITVAPQSLVYIYE